MKLNNKERVILRILRDIDIEYNANNLSKVIGLSSMGVLKILKQLKDENLLLSRKVSNINFYEFNFFNLYAKDFASLILRKEADSSSPYIKRWINELRNLKFVKVGILFGSVLTKERNAKDIDVLFVLKKKNFSKVKSLINNLNRISEKEIHVVYQIKEDLFKNINKKDKILLEILKGIVFSGEKDFVKILNEADGSHKK